MIAGGGGSVIDHEVCLLGAWREVSTRARERDGVSGRGYDCDAVRVSAVVAGRWMAAELVLAMPLMSPVNALTCQPLLLLSLTLPSRRSVSPSVLVPLSTLVLSL